MNNENNKKQIKILIVLFSLLLLHCDFITDQNNDDIVRINFPINKTIVYVSAGFTEKDSLSLETLEVIAIQYDSTYQSEDTTYFIGTTREYRPKNSGAFLDTGKIVTSIDKRWVNIQYNDIPSTGYVVFLKSTVNTATDTTIIPTDNHQQHPVYPSEIEPFQEYSIYRPSGSGNSIFDITRYYKTDDFIEWDDDYGSESGIGIELLLPDDLFFHAIIDDHGIIISQKSYKDQIIMDEYGNILDTVNIHYINRRIKDFTNPNSIRDLSYYSDLVIENGLQFIERNPN